MDDRPDPGDCPDGAAAVSELAAARRRRRAARRAGLAAAATVAVLAGVVVGWRLLGGDPGGDMLVVAAPGDGDRAGDAVASSGAGPDAAGGGAAAPTAATPAAAAPAASAPAAAASGGGAALAEAAGPADESRLPVTPEELSTGPALDWTEAQTGFRELWSLQSLGDGRVLAYASRDVAQLPQIDIREMTVVTSDGVDWSEVELPAAVAAHHVAVSGDLWVVAGFDRRDDNTSSSAVPGAGDLWVVAGFDRPSLHPPPSAGAASRVFVSQDGAATWAELELDVDPGPAPASPWVEHRTAVASALVSGEDIVLAVGVSAHLDAAGLIEAGGLLPEGRSAAVWGVYVGEGEGEVTVTLADPAAAEQAPPATPAEGDPAAVPADPGVEGAARAAPVPPDEGDRASDGGAEGPERGADGARSVEGDYASGFAAGETLRFTFDELGLTVEEQDALLGEPSSLLLVWSDGDTVGEAVEVSGARDFLGVRGAASGDGFVIQLVGPPQGSILTSPDGRTWTEHPYDTFGLYGAVVHRGSVWAAVDEPSGMSLKRAAPGADPLTVAGFEGIRVLELGAGPAGLFATAATLPSTGAADGSDPDAAMPNVRISRDGYELRYNEPPGGVTLWGLGAGEAVRVFEASELDGDEPVEGVREDADESGRWVTFTDPGTGEDLVTFEPEDFEAVFEALMAEGILAPGTDLPLESDPRSPMPDEWVGWSADGTSWGWQTMTEAFGVGAGEAWLELAVGHDFAVAAVQPFGTPPVPAPGSADALAAQPERVRVFTAPVP